MPVEVPGEVARVFVLWLDGEQLDALDATEPNYWRRTLPSERFPVDLASGVRIPNCFIYVGKHGCLVNAAGEPRRLISQMSLIEQLLAESTALRDLCGATVHDFTASVRHEAVRQAVRQLFINEKRAQAQPSLESLPSALTAQQGAARRRLTL